METSRLLGQSVRKKILKRIQFNLKRKRGNGPVTQEGGGGSEENSVNFGETLNAEEVGRCEDELRRLFSYIDKDGSLTLSRYEFKAFLGDLHISFSAKRWRQIFRYVLA